MPYGNQTVKMEILQQLKAIELKNCKIELIGSWLWVSGDTYTIKDKLKELGFFFSGNKKAWFFNGQSCKEKKRKEKELEQLFNSIYIKSKSKRSFYNSLEELKTKWGAENVLL